MTQSRTERCPLCLGSGTDPVVLDRCTRCAPKEEDR